jgi:hypothetical protein
MAGREPRQAVGSTRSEIFDRQPDALHVRGGAQGALQEITALGSCGRRGIGERKRREHDTEDVSYDAHFGA